MVEGEQERSRDAIGSPLSSPTIENDMDQGLVFLGTVAIGVIGLVFGTIMTLATLFGKKFRLEFTRSSVRLTVSSSSK